MGKKLLVLGLATLVCMFLAPAINSQQGGNSPGDKDVISAPGTTVTLSITFSYPYEIKRYRVTSTSGGFTIQMADWNPTNYPDYWKATAYSWDRFPYMVQGVSVPGTGTAYGPYTGKVTCQATKGGSNKWYLEVRYAKGCDSFAGSMRVRLNGPGTITATAITTAP